MTKLEKFRESAKGVALSAVITAALFPAAHDYMASKVNDGLKQDIIARQASWIVQRPAVSYEEGKGWVSPYSADIKKLEIQAEVLEAAASRLDGRNRMLERGLTSFGILHARLQAMADGVGGDVTQKEQMQIFAEAVRGGLKMMRREWDTAPSAGPAGRSAEAVDASGQSHYVLGGSLEGFHSTAAMLQGKVKGLADEINARLYDNELLEKALQTLSERFDEMLQATEYGEDGLEPATQAMQAVEAILNQYEAAPDDALAEPASDMPAQEEEPASPGRML